MLSSVREIIALGGNNESGAEKEKEEKTPDLVGGVAGIGVYVVDEEDGGEEG